MHFLNQLKKHNLLINELIFKLFDFREGEERRVFLMWTYIFLIITALMIIKPVVSALFLSTFGVERLPQVFILMAITAAVVSTIYSNLLKTNNLYKLIHLTLISTAALFALFWLLLTFQVLGDITLYVFYIAVAIFAVISSSQFWIMANNIFNAREAKRLFGFIGSGAITGGIVGGYLTNLLVGLIGSENLILVFLLFIALSLQILKKLWQEKSPSIVSGNENSGINQPLKSNPWLYIKNSKHLTILAALVGIGVFTGKLVEFQYSAIASELITDSDQLTAFFGFWFSNLNIITLVIQLLVTRRIVGVYGVGTSLFFLPVAILLGAGSLLFFPELWAAILIKLCDGSLKNSVNKAGMELLFLPVAIDIRTQAKSFIDIFVDSFATGLSGILLIILSVIFNINTQQVSLLIIFIIGIWIFLIFKIRKEYLNSFRLKIEIVESDQKKEIDLTKISVFSGIEKVLKEGTDKQILQVLKMLRNTLNQRLLVPYSNLIGHESPLVRLEVLKQLYFYKDGDLSALIKPFVDDENLDIRSEALHYVYQKTGYEKYNLLSDYLNHEDYKLRSAAIICTARESRENLHLKNLFKIEETIISELTRVKNLNKQNEIIALKRSCARAIGEAHLKSLFPLLNILLQDPQADVVKAAIIGAGLSKEREFGPLLIQLLKDPVYWSFTQTALVNFGANIIDILSSHLRNPYVDIKARINIPKVMAEIEQQKSVDELFRSLTVKERPLRNEVINALFKLRRNAPQLQFMESEIMELIFTEADDYLFTLSFLYNQTELELKNPSSNGKIKEARESLIKDLENRLDYKLKRIFIMLGLKYPPIDIQNAYVGISSSDSELRMNAVEFLDNLLDKDLKKVIVPIAESALLDGVISNTLSSLGVKMEKEETYLETILNSDSASLRYKTLLLIGYLNDRKYLTLVAKCLDDSNDRVKNLARSILTHMGL
jgi:ATP:ADP antiporter, AAA family